MQVTLTNVPMTNHGIGHTTTGRNGRSEVQCVCGAKLGTLKRYNHERFGRVVDAYDADDKRFLCGVKTSAALRAFEDKNPEHTNGLVTP